MPIQTSNVKRTNFKTSKIMNYLERSGWRRGDRVLNLSINLDSITIYMVSKIAGQLVDPFPVKVKPPFVYTASIDVFVGNKSPSV